MVLSVRQDLVCAIPFRNWIPGTPIHLERLVYEWADGVERLLPLHDVDGYGGMLLFCYIDGRPALPDAFDGALAAVGAKISREDIHAHVYPGPMMYTGAFWNSRLDPPPH